MDDCLKELISGWAEKNNAMGGKTEVKGNLREIATNCISLANAWINRVKNTDENVGFQLIIFDKFGEERDRIIDVNTTVLPKIMLEAITFGVNDTTRLELHSYKFVDGKKQMELVGELDVN